MRKVIGIVGEGPTDYMVIKEVIDHITGEANEYIAGAEYRAGIEQFAGWKATGYPKLS